MTLHIIALSPQALASSQVRCAVKDGDDIILVENGVYNLLNISTTGLANPTIPLYALDADVNARGLGDKVEGIAQLIDYDQWVDLSARQPNSLSWYP